MDPINARFLKRLVRALEGIERHIKASLDQQENAASKQQQVAENQNGQPRPIEIRSEWRNVRTMLEFAGFGTAVVLASLTYFTLQKVSAQAESAHEQVRIMQRQLEATDRPWIEIVNAEQTAGIRFHRRVDNGHPMAYAPFKVRVKNVGRSVAVDVKMTSRLLFELPDDTNYSLRERQSRICAQPDNLLTSPEFTLFPGQDSGDRLSNSFDELIPEEALYPMPGKDLWIKPIIAGCITYRLNPADTMIHEDARNSVESKRLSKS